MSLKNAFIIFILFIVFMLSPVVMAGAQPAVSPRPSQVDLGDIKGAVVTLCYYDRATGGKGAIVPLPDGQNPQEVQWDANSSSPGTYTFYRVPQGTYYVEAVHNNHTWFAIVTVDRGTSTANVAIPPFNDSGFGTAPLSEATPLPSPSATVAVTPSTPHEPTTSPGMTTLCALTGLTLVALYVIKR